MFPRNMALIIVRPSLCSLCSKRLAHGWIGSNSRREHEKTSMPGSCALLDGQTTTDKIFFHQLFCFTVVPMEN